MEIGTTLAASKKSASSGKGLSGTGFWPLVRKVGRDPQLVRRWAKEIAEIDRIAFEHAVKARVPAPVGTSALLFGFAASVATLVLARAFNAIFVRTLLFSLAFAGLLVTTHCLAHWAVGRVLGIRFTHYFLGGPPPPRPGAKTDYESYLKASPNKRALMHASGAVVTKILPFAMIPIGRSLQVYGWALAGLAAIGVVQIITDVLFSTKTSDWKKVKRELRAASAVRRHPKSGR